MSIRFQSFEGASENVWHVLVRNHSWDLSYVQNVQNNSPASEAGLISDNDYIVGSEGASSDVAELIQANNMKPVRLHVYNSTNNECREVVVTPNDAWGGDGRCATIV